MGSVIFIVINSSLTASFAVHMEAFQGSEISSFQHLLLISYHQKTHFYISYVFCI
jgi:hypothetical protein